MRLGLSPKAERDYRLPRHLKLVKCFAILYRCRRQLPTRMEPILSAPFRYATSPREGVSWPRRWARARAFGGLEQFVSLARPLLGQQRIAAHHEALARIVRRCGSRRDPSRRTAESHCTAPDSSSDRTAGPRSALIQSSPDVGEIGSGNVGSRQMRASVNIRAARPPTPRAWRTSGQVGA